MFYQPYRNFPFLVDYLVLIQKSEKYTFVTLVLFYGKNMWQMLIFHFFGLIQDSKTGYSGTC